ncbi:MAG: hypothetical protein CEE41_04420 [Hadesarchaea archaeon B3_Hades]|nr:MAG: hypothetical protein CEE41_04420 [Hadesarchaea archaeon B3_Hades]
MTENIEIVFGPDEITIDHRPDAIAAIPCPEGLHEDVYLYLLGALPEVIRDGIKGAEEFHRG